MISVKDAVGTPYEAPGHFGVYGIKKITPDQSQKFMVNVSYFAPNGGCDMGAGPIERIYYIVNGHELEHVELTQLRGFEGVRAATVELGREIGSVKVAMAHGLKPTRQIVEAVLAGTAHFDFIEIMACPGGCVDGLSLIHI